MESLCAWRVHITHGQPKWFNYLSAAQGAICESTFGLGRTLGGTHLATLPTTRRCACEFHSGTQQGPLKGPTSIYIYIYATPPPNGPWFYCFFGDGNSRIYCGSPKPDLEPGVLHNVPRGYAFQIGFYFNYNWNVEYSLVRI